MSPLEEMIADKLDEVATAKAAHPLAELARYGVRSFVIGESLLLQSDIEAATRAILANPLAGNAGM